MLDLNLDGTRPGTSREVERRVGERVKVARSPEALPRSILPTLPGLSEVMHHEHSAAVVRLQSTQRAEYRTHLLHAVSVGRTDPADERIVHDERGRDALDLSAEPRYPALVVEQ